MALDKEQNSKALSVLLSISITISLTVGGWLASTTASLNTEVAKVRAEMEMLKELKQELRSYNAVASANFGELYNRLTILETKAEIDNTRTRKPTQ